LSQFKEYHPSGNLKFNNLGIFQSFKLRGNNPSNFSQAKFRTEYFGLLWVKVRATTYLKMGTGNTLRNLSEERFLNFDKLCRLYNIQYFFYLAKEHDLRTELKLDILTSKNSLPFSKIRIKKRRLHYLLLCSTCRRQVERMEAHSQASSRLLLGRSRLLPKIKRSCDSEKAPNLTNAVVLTVQKVLSGSGRATRLWSTYFSLKRSFPTPPEAANAF